VPKKKLSSDPEARAAGDRLAKLLVSPTVAAIKKMHGSNILIRGAEYRVQTYCRLPSGIFPLDYALGGGFAVGMVHTFWGKKDSGKTSKILRVIANAQRRCSACFRLRPEWAHLAPGILDGSSVISDSEHVCACKKPRDFVVVYLDIEGTLSIQWAKALGVDTDQIVLSKPEYAEQGIDVAEGMMRTGELDILALDSLAFMTPANEIKKSAVDSLVGEQARKLGTGVRKLVAAFNFCENNFRRRPTVFFTNQERMKVGLVFGDPTTVSGGMAPGFIASTEVKCWPGKYVMDTYDPKKNPEGTGRPISGNLQFRVDKNKTGHPKMEGEYKIVLSETPVKKKGEVADEDFMVDLAERVGLIGQKGGWSCLGETDHGSKLAIVERLEKEPYFKARLRESLLKVLSS